MSEEQNEVLEITNENFEEYFRDVRKTAPRKGEVMVRYISGAEFISGHEKRHMIQLVQMKGKMEAATQIMRKLLFASEIDAYRVPKAILSDLIEGLSEEEVLEKPYPYTIEIFYYTKPEYVPKDDPHWSQITMLNLDDFVDKQESKESGQMS